MPHPGSYRVLFPIALMVLLSACASRPQLTAQQEAGEYRSRASRTYTPPGPRSDPWGPYVTEASGRFDVPERWIREVMRQESGGRSSSALATSGPGAMGLMQVMPGTYDELRGRYGDLGSDPYDPHDNIMAGTAYIRELYDIYGSPGFLAAYNAGPGRLDDYLTRGRVLPGETRRYVAAIGPRITGSTPSRTSPGEAYAMNALPIAIPDGPRYARDDRYSTPTQLDAGAPPVSSAPLPRQVVQVAALPEPPRPIVLGVPTAAQFAEAPPAARPIQLGVPTPIRLGEPTPAQQFASLAPRPPEPRAFEPRVSESRAVESRPAESRLAPPALPMPPPPPPPPMQLASYTPAAPRTIFRLVSPATAEPLARPHGGSGGGNWAVQVGAFANDRMAVAATASAREQARDALAGAHTTVSSVRQGGSTLYRARLHGLSREGAQQACERLARQRTNCILVSPDAQS